MHIDKLHQKRAKRQKLIAKAKEERDPREPWPMAVVTKGTLKCPTCETSLRPKQNINNCCKSAYRQYMKKHYPKG